MLPQQTSCSTHFLCKSYRFPVFLPSHFRKSSFHLIIMRVGSDTLGRCNSWWSPLAALLLWSHRLDKACQYDSQPADALHSAPCSPTHLARQVHRPIVFPPPRRGEFRGEAARHQLHRGRLPSGVDGAGHTTECPARRHYRSLL